MVRAGGENGDMVWQFASKPTRVTEGRSKQKRGIRDQKETEQRNPIFLHISRLRSAPRRRKKPIGLRKINFVGALVTPVVPVNHYFGVV